MPPRFTIITVVLNGEQYIRRCVESVLKQDFESFEYLIIDGISRDKTLEIVGEYAEDARMKVVSEKDKGIYDAMNKGIRMARGEWIFFLGFDDYLLDTGILSRVDAQIRQTPCDFFYGKVQWGDTGRFFGHEVRANDLKNHFMCHQAVFVKKSVFDRIGLFDVKYKLNADAVFIIQCFHNEHIRTQFADLAIAYFSIGGLSQTRTDQQFVKYKYTLFQELSALEQLKKYYFLYKPDWFRPTLWWRRLRQNYRKDFA